MPPAAAVDIVLEHHILVGNVPVNALLQMEGGSRDEHSSVVVVHQVHVQRLQDFEGRDGQKARMDRMMEAGARRKEGHEVVGVDQPLGNMEEGRL